MTDKKNTRETINIILDNGQEIICTYDEQVFDEVIKELHTAILTGGLFSIDASYDADMHDIAGNYLTCLNGNKIVGYNF